MLFFFGGLVRRLLYMLSQDTVGRNRVEYIGYIHLFYKKAIKVETMRSVKVGATHTSNEKLTLRSISNCL